MFQGFDPDLAFEVDLIGFDQDYTVEYKVESSDKIKFTIKADNSWYKEYRGIFRVVNLRYLKLEDKNYIFSIEIHQPGLAFKLRPQ